MKGRNIIWLFVTFIILFSMGSVNASSYKDLTTDKALDMMIQNSELVIIDVSMAFEKGTCPELSIIR